jgi:hypothetical protein
VFSSFFEVFELFRAFRPFGDRGPKGCLYQDKQGGGVSKGEVFDEPKDRRTVMCSDVVTHTRASSNRFAFTIYSSVGVRDIDLSRN